MLQEVRSIKIDNWLLYFIPTLSNYRIITLSNYHII